MKGNELGIPQEIIMNKIYIVRGVKVMLDRDLASLYYVETKRLKEQVRRNIDRFPEDFMFEMTKEELIEWRSQFAKTKGEIMGIRVPPFVFTEHGVLMLSSILNSKRAVKVNIQIMRIFTRMNKMILTSNDLLLKMENIELKLENHDEKLNMLYKHLKQLFEDKEQAETQSNRRKIGYKSEEEE